jgi:hypothetical protein
VTFYALFRYDMFEKIDNEFGVGMQVRVKFIGMKI